MNLILDLITLSMSKPKLVVGFEPTNTPTIERQSLSIPRWCKTASMKVYIASSSEESFSVCQRKNTTMLKNKPFFGNQHFSCDDFPVSGQKCLHIFILERIQKILDRQWLSRLLSYPFHDTAINQQNNLLFSVTMSMSDVIVVADRCNTWVGSIYSDVLPVIFFWAFPLLHY